MFCLTNCQYLCFCVKLFIKLFSFWPFSNWSSTFRYPPLPNITWKLYLICDEINYIEKFHIQSELNKLRYNVPTMCKVLILPVIVEQKWLCVKCVDDNRKMILILCINFITIRQIQFIGLNLKYNAILAVFSPLNVPDKS